MTTMLERNAPCHCGSGRKYKKCCLESDASKATAQRVEAARKALARAEERLRNGKKEQDREARERPELPSSRKQSPAAVVEPPAPVMPVLPGPSKTPVVPLSQPVARGPRKREQRAPTIAAWLDAWFPDPDMVERIRSLARTSKGKWKAKAGWGHFAGWAQGKGLMPVRVEGFWDPPTLEGSCTECGRLERCIHVAALALALEGVDGPGPDAPREEHHPCRPRLVFGRWSVSTGRKARRIDGARLSFRYGPREVDELERVGFLGWADGDVQVRCPRDLDGEDSVRKRLDGLGWSREGLSPLRTPQAGDLESVLDFLESVAPVLRSEGWEVEVDPSLDLQLHEVDSWRGRWKDEGQGWFGMELSLEVAGKKVDVVDLCRRILAGNHLSAILERLRAGRSLTVSLGGGYVRLPPERLLPILSGLALFAGGEGGAPKVSKLVAARMGNLGMEDGDWDGFEALAELRTRLASCTAPEMPEPPVGLHASLRPYQSFGLSWLRWLSRHGFGGILADDMGLGKTLQTIAHLACEKAQDKMVHPSLVVCPTSLAPNWADELARFAPHLETVVLHGARREGLREAAQRADVVITTYPLVARDEAWLLEQSWHVLVLDEAQFLKNARTQARAVLARLTAASRLALTGTPMENHLGELWSLVDLVQPGLLGSERHFARQVRPRIERMGDDDLRDRLRQVVAPFLLRRTKDQVAADLPPKTEIVQHVDLQGPQRDLYESVRASQDERLKGVLQAQGIEKSSIQILDALLRLRQACCDPRLLPRAVSKGCKESAKLEWLGQVLPEMVEEGRRILVFSQFTALLDLVEPLLREAGISHVRLDGSTSDRGTVVRSFQEGEAPVFLLSLKAGGTGLNLVGADTVVFLDPWWNPAAEAQAMDRAHRIGQTRPVFVYKLVARGTVEEKILALQERKAELAASILEGGGAASLRFDADDLADLMRPLA